MQSPYGHWRTFTHIDMTRIFYQLMRIAYDKVYGRQHMLHYPLYKKGGQDLMAGQVHFTEHCIAQLPDLAGKRVLDVGCGNAIQTMYLHSRYRPEYVLGIDINKSHIQFGNSEKQRRGLHNIDFTIDDAQVLASVEDTSFDIIICIESAHHYPDKNAFLIQIKRVLRPGGYLLIADLLRRDTGDPNVIERKLGLFHWSRPKYQDVLSSLKLVLVKEEDLTDLILPAFADAEAWFPRREGISNLSYKLVKTFGRSLIRLYVYQLSHSLRYHLMLCHNGPS